MHSMVELLRYIAAAGIWLILLLQSAYAQSPTDEFSRIKTQEQRLERLDELQSQTPRTVISRTKADSLTGPGGPCFSIQTILVEGVSLIASKDVTTITRKYAGRCIGIGEINSILKDVTHLYIDRGFIASRAYIPEQDIATSGALKITVVEGTLADIYLNGKKPLHSGLIVTAFPGMVGSPINIRDMEQGLDQINRLPSSKASTELLPGSSEGSSILNIALERKNPWHISVANNNLGQKSTGSSKSNVSLRQDNLLDINDVMALSYERSGPDYPGKSDGWGRSNSVSGSYQIPYGYWTFEINGSWYQYTSSVPGSFTSMETEGTSSQWGATIERVVHRGKNSITQVQGGLTYKETDNFLLGNLIEVGSRRYTVGSLGISHSRSALGVSWSFDISVDQGLDLFNAVDANAPGAGDADPNFTKFSATVNASFPFELGGQRFEANSLFNGQMSDDNLFGAEQTSLGGFSNVRGSREGLLFANNGFFVRNELVWRTIPWENNTRVTELLGEWKPYLGLDHGRVFAQPAYQIDSGEMFGWTIGSRLSGGRLNVDIGYSDGKVSNRSQNDTGLFFVVTSLKW